MKESSGIRVAWRPTASFSNLLVVAQFPSSNAESDAGLGSETKQLRVLFANRNSPNGGFLIGRENFPIRRLFDDLPRESAGLLESVGVSGPTQIAPSRDLASADETEAGCENPLPPSNGVTEASWVIVISTRASNEAIAQSRIVAKRGKSGKCGNRKSRKCEDSRRVQNIPNQLSSRQDFA